VQLATDYVVTDAAVRAELCVPVVLGDEVLAIIDSGAYSVDAFSPAHASFIEGFARYLAPAIADPLGFLRSWRPGLVEGMHALAPLAQSINFLYTWHEEWRSRFAGLYTEVAQRNAELLALTTLSATLNSSLRLDTILAATVAKVAELLACQVSWILLPDDDGCLRVRALHGGSAAVQTEMGMAADNSPHARVFASGEAIIVNDCDRMPRSSFDWAFCHHNGITRYASVPLRTRERTIGVMTVGRTYSGDELSDADVRLLSAFAGQIALAIENADLYEHSHMLGAAEERARLARDLHDTLAQSMLTVLRSLEQIEAEAVALPDAQRAKLAQARSLARQSLDEARRSMWNLQLTGLEHTTLRQALEQHAAAWSAQTGIRLKFEQKGRAISLAPSVEREVLLIAREALNNAGRHAAANSVHVSLLYGRAGLRLLISDDGRGFDPQGYFADMTSGHARERRDVLGGLGLRGMRERAQKLGALLHVESAPGWGTRIVLTLPLSLPRTTAGNVLPRTFAPALPAEAPADGEAVAWPPDVNAVRVADAVAPAALLGNTNGLKEDGGPTTVLLVDDHQALRDGLCAALEAVADLHVAGVASTGEEALALAHALRPDVLLLDIQLPQEDGLDILRRLRADALSTQVVMFTAHDDDARVAAALAAGATGYLLKDIALPELARAIRAAARGRRVLSPAIAARLSGRAGLLVNPHASQLTAREHEVLEMLANGMRNRAIAQRLCVSEATVKFHLINLYQKLHSSSRVEALNRARQWGLLQ
jgi:DNA-binding NarL/FixJ family response regulator/signal transduction histidine kinase